MKFLTLDDRKNLDLQQEEPPIYVVEDLLGTDFVLLTFETSEKKKLLLFYDTWEQPDFPFFAKEKTDTKANLWDNQFIAFIMYHNYLKKRIEINKINELPGNLVMDPNPFSDDASFFSYSIIDYYSEPVDKLLERANIPEHMSHLLYYIPRSKEDIEFIKQNYPNYFFDEKKAEMLLPLRHPARFLYIMDKVKNSTVEHYVNSIEGENPLLQAIVLYHAEHRIDLKYLFHVFDIEEDPMITKMFREGNVFTQSEIIYKILTFQLQSLYLDLDNNELEL